MRRLLSALLLAAAAGCRTDAITNTDIVAGTYTLQSVNGAPLPYVLQASPTRVEVLSDILILDRGNTWSESVQYRETTGTGSTSIRSSDDGGFYSVQGNKVVIEYGNGATDAAAYANGTLRFSTGAGTSLYVRQ